jgi:hypothetical protein
MIWPMVEQAHFGTTRYTTLSLSVIQVPGKPIFRHLPCLCAPDRDTIQHEKANNFCSFNGASALLDQHGTE